jgi:hypothetical protein
MAAIEFVLIAVITGTLLLASPGYRLESYQLLFGEIK